jgi:hypothetical protein
MARPLPQQHLEFDFFSGPLRVYFPSSGAKAFPGAIKLPLNLNRHGTKIRVSFQRRTKLNPHTAHHARVISHRADIEKSVAQRILKASRELTARGSKIHFWAFRSHQTKPRVRQPSHLSPQPSRARSANFNSQDHRHLIKIWYFFSSYKILLGLPNDGNFSLCL